MTEEYHCQVCCSQKLSEFNGFERLSRITSDCKPFRAGGHLVECSDCGATQTLPSADWLAEISDIYAQFTPYYQSAGVEQLVLDNDTGTLRRRSDVIVSRLIADQVLPPSGRALDIGCGSGVTLRALSTALPGWKLFGQDIDNNGRDHLAAIPSFTQYYACSPSQIDGKFDLITLIHSLEHFPSPYSILDQLRQKLNLGGRLFVQVPNALENPFELVIADHLMHFTPRTLAQLVERAGFKVEILETNWVTKEISLLAWPMRATVRNSVSFRDFSDVRFGSAGLQWLQSVVDDAIACADESKDFGVFGTSIAATWLAGTLNGKVHFFVDEDPSCQGRKHMGCPVFAPDQMPRDAQIFLALVPKIAAKVSKRLTAYGIRSTAPGPIEYP